LALTPDARLPLPQRERLTIELKIEAVPVQGSWRGTGPFVAPRNDANDSLISKKVHLEISSFSFERTKPIVR
jgi:hypothetical protein